jgi:hypothetical protein
LLKETGSLEKRPLNRTFKKIDPVELAEFIVEKPDGYLGFPPQPCKNQATAL